MFVMFLRTGNPSYLDMMIQIAFNPISVVCFVWFPIYYATWAILMLCQMNGVHVFSLEYFQYMNQLLTNCHGIFFGADYFTPVYSGMINASQVSDAFTQLSVLGDNAFIWLLDMAWKVILYMIAFCLFQSWICLFLDRRKLGMDWRLSGCWKGILLSPLFSFIYGICNCIGAVSKPKWIVSKRNPKQVDIRLPLPERPKKIWWMKISDRQKNKYNGRWWKKA
jgi:hypothetical protein